MAPTEQPDVSRTRFDDLADELRRQSRKFRTAAWFFVTAIVSVVVSSVLYFFNSAQIAGAVDQNFGVRLLETIGKTLEAGNSNDWLKAWGPEALEKAVGGSTMSIVATAIGRLGAIAIALYLVQILLGFARYHFKLSDQLSLLAKCVRVSEGRIADLRELMSLMSTSHIGFGKTPETPIERIVEAVREAVTRSRG